jgi:DnaJ-class molecular chaperone
MNHPAMPPDLFPKDPNNCPFCNGTGTKRWGRLGVRACVYCKGTGKKER